VSTSIQHTLAFFRGPTSLTVTFFVVWDTLAESTARVGTPTHAEMVHKLDALVDDLSRKRVLHVQVPEHLVMAAVEAPVTELDIIIVRDVEALAEYEPCSEVVMSKLRAVQLDSIP